jgi:multicomponent Na+:H+ antiporter subunit E
MVATVLLRLVLWLLLTGNVGAVNLGVGLLVALLLPGRLGGRWDGAALGQVLRVIPQAYREALEMMLHPHTQEVIRVQGVAPNRTPGLIFLDTFLITVTPKTIVLNYREAEGYVVHYVQPPSE